MQVAVLSTAASKYCSLSSKELWGLTWEEFLSEVEYSHMMQACELASIPDHKNQR